MADELVKGAKDVVAALSKIEQRLSEATRSAVAEAAHLVEAGTKGNAPVKTGTLRRSVRVFGPDSKGRGVWTAWVGPTVAYGRRVELGFHGTDRRGRHYDQPGRPYLRPAYQAAMAGPVAAIFARHWGGAVRGS